MLENGVRGMIYAGESDFICNFAGNLDWTRKMEWSGREEFAKKFSSPFVIDEEEGWTGGEVVENDDGRFSFVKVSQAGSHGSFGSTKSSPGDAPKICKRGKTLQPGEKEEEKARFERERSRSPRLTSMEFFFAVILHRYTQYTIQKTINHATTS